MIGDLVRKWDEYPDKEARTQLRGGGAPPGPLAMIWAAASAFRFRFFVAKGYRDGVAGLVLSVLFAVYRFEGGRPRCGRLPATGAMRTRRFAASARSRGWRPRSPGTGSAGCGRVGARREGQRDLATFHPGASPRFSPRGPRRARAPLSPQDPHAAPGNV